MQEPDFAAFGRPSNGGRARVSRSSTSRRSSSARRCPTRPRRRSGCSPGRSSRSPGRATGSISRPTRSTPSTTELRHAPKGALPVPGQTAVRLTVAAPACSGSPARSFRTDVPSAVERSRLRPRPGGLSIRALARSMRFHRRAVRQVLASPLPPVKRSPSSRPARKLGAYRALSDSWLMADRAAPRKQRDTTRARITTLAKGPRCR